MALTATWEMNMGYKSRHGKLGTRNTTTKSQFGRRLPE